MFVRPVTRSTADLPTPPTFQPGRVYECLTSGHPAYLVVQPDGSDQIHVAEGWETNAELRHRLRQQHAQGLHLMR